jgi:hypothetical protein
MRRHFYVLYVASVLIAPFTLTAQSPKAGTSAEAPAPIVIAGLQAYKDKGPEEAVRTWIKGSGIDGSKDALAQANTLRQVEDYYGKYQSYEVVKTQSISPKVQVVYLVLDYEKGPLFTKFVNFHSDQGWILAYFNFNTKEEVILPPGQ